MGKLSDTGLTSDAKELEPKRFSEPWHARLFAITVALSESGSFSWPEWTEMLGRQLANQEVGTDFSVDESYYRSWLAALIHLLQERDLADTTEIDDLEDLWRKAPLAMPHGLPIQLSEAPVAQSRRRNA